MDFIASVPWAFILGGFFGVVGLSVWEQGRYFETAIQAAGSSRKVDGIVTITTSSWSDAIHYHARVTPTQGQPWQFEFVPLKWEPAEGTFRAVIFYAKNAPWPALIETEMGLVFPKYKPEMSNRHLA